MVASLQDLKRPSIFLIDNDIDCGQTFALNLAEEMDEAVIHVSDVRDLPSDIQPGVLLIDVETVGSDRTITALKQRFGVAVIAISSRPSMANAVKTMRAGANDFFPKPASVKAIAESLKSLMVRYGPGLTHGDTLDMFGSTPIPPFWQQERQIIEHALGACNGNISKAAAALQISPSTIYRKKQDWDNRPSK